VSSSAKRILRVATACGLLIALHIAATADRIEVALAALVLNAAVQGVSGGRFARTRNRLLWAAACGTVGAAIVAIAQIVPSKMSVLYALPVLINLFLCIYFASTLRPGREPMITRFCRSDLGVVPDEFRRYTRLLTMFWAMLFAVLATENLLLAMFSSVQIWSVFANFGNYALVGGAFLGEHVLRSFLFPQHGVASPIRSVRAVARVMGSAD
jgi:uncharacterized membrane protein